MDQVVAWEKGMSKVAERKRNLGCGWLKRNRGGVKSTQVEINRKVEQFACYFYCRYVLVALPV